MADDSGAGKLVTLRQYVDVPQALLAKSILDSADVECYLGDENMIRLDWFLSNLLGGVKLWVREDDVEAATELLDQHSPESFEVEGVGEYEQPRCPYCRSFDITFEDLNKRVAFVSAWLLGLPIAVKNPHWKCNACGKEWP